MKEFALAFGTGLLSFLSPCVLPLIPGYISFITGFTPSQLENVRGRDKWAVLAPSLLFVAGFSIVFVAMGASASALGALIARYSLVLRYVAGAFITLMGVFMLGIFKVPWLYGEARFEMSKARSLGRGASLFMGMAFAFGWTPCVGPMLASILTLAGSVGEVGRGAALLFAYSAGLGVPFLAVGVLFGSMKGTLRWLTAHSLVLNRVAGAFLVLLGILILTGQLNVLASFLTDRLPSVEL